MLKRSEVRRDLTKCQEMSRVVILTFEENDICVCVSLMSSSKPSVSARHLIALFLFLDPRLGEGASIEMDQGFHDALSFRH